MGQSKLFETVRDFNAGQQTIAKRSYGVIEAADGKFVGIHLRPWPKVVSIVEAKWMGGWQHQRRERDHCLIYYNQPIAHRNFLAFKYVITSLGTSFKTLRRALIVLDEVARVKGTDAIVAEITNRRISDRFMRRFGCEPHLPNQKGRHYIKRFYGEYPSAELAQEVLAAEPTNGVSGTTPLVPTVPTTHLAPPNSVNQTT